MAVLKVLTVLVAAVAVMLGVFWHQTQAPEDMDGKFEGRLATVVGRVVTGLGRFAEFFGGDRTYVKSAIVRSLSQFASNSNPNVTISNAEFDGIPVRVYDPIGRKPGGPAVVFFHSGGWVFHSAETYDAPILQLSDLTKFLFVSVNYRLAPKHIFPAAVEDCRKVTEYLMQQTASEYYKIDPTRVAVMGDSAGGNIAAAVVLWLRNDKRALPKLQIPIYPVLQGLDFHLPSYQNDTGIILSQQDMVSFICLYLLGIEPRPEWIELANANRLYSSSVWAKHGHKLAHNLLPKESFHRGYKPAPVPEGVVGVSERLDKLVTDPRFAPLMADDLRGLPDTVLLTCRYDVLRDEGFLYERRLREAGVKVTHIKHPTCFHGAFLLLPNHDSVRMIAKQLAEKL